MRRQTLLLYSIFVPLAFDRKGGENGDLLVYVVTASALLMLFVFFGFAGWPRYRRGLERYMGYATFVPMLATFIPLLIGTVDLAPFARASVPYVFFFLGYHLSLRLARMGNEGELIRVAYNASMMSVIFAPIAVLVNGHASLESVRFSILSQFSGVAFLVSLYRIVVERQFTKQHVIVFLLILSTAFISLTRSYVIALAAGAFFLIYVNAKANSTRIRYSQVMSYAIIVALLVLFWSMLFPSMLESWRGRLFGGYEQTGFDITSLTRIAEIVGQWDLLTSNFSSMLFGRGLGSPYMWSQDDFFLSILGAVDSIRDYSFTYTYPGHNFWVYSLYANGFVMGLILPSALFAVFFSSVRMVRQDWFARIGKREQCSIALGTAYIAMTLAATIGGNPLGGRGGGFLFGVFLGFLVASLTKVRISLIASSTETIRELP